MDEAMNDKRFSHIYSDPRFRKMPKNVRKITVDKRFNAMFTGKEFTGNCVLDKRGRPLQLKSSENLKNLYDASSESSEEDDDDESERSMKSSRDVIKKKKPLREEMSSEKGNEADRKQKMKNAEEMKDSLKSISNKLYPKEEDSSEPSESEDDIESKYENNTKSSKNAKKANMVVTKKHLPKKMAYDKGDEAERKQKQKIQKVKNTEEKIDSLKSISNKLYHKEESSESSEGEDDVESKCEENTKSNQNAKRVNMVVVKKKLPEKMSYDKGNEAKNKQKQKIKKVEKKDFLKSISNKLYRKEESFESDSEESSKVNAESLCNKISNKYSSQKQDELKSESADSELSENETDNSSVEKHMKLKQQDKVSSKKKSSESSLKKKESSAESDDSDSESDDSSGDQSEDFDHQWEELRNEAPDTENVFRRIAVCNMDWDRIRAEDLFTCFNSFKLPDGCIYSVKIYPSEFGLKRMEQEKLCGPAELTEKTLPLDEEEQEDRKGSRYHREKLRQYQINRLKYYYAVIDCDSPETANYLYEQLNGMEYESSSVRFDLRFIPDDVTFDHEPISVVDKVPNPSEYKPRLFVTAALQQVKVDLTWDETDPKRRETLQKAFTEPESIEQDIRNYFASSSSESEEEQYTDEKEDKMLKTKERISKYKELMLSLEEKEKKEKEEKNKYVMEISWEPGLKEKTEEIVKGRMKNDSLNPFDEMIQKKKDDRKLKKKQEKAMQEQVEEDSDFSGSDEELFSKKTLDSKDKSHNTKQLAELALISDSKKVINFEENVNKKRKRKEKAQNVDDFKLDVNDPRFSAIYSSHLYNIDPSDPHYKDNEGNRALIQEKQRRLKLKGFHEKSKNPKRSRYC